jgi:hypothetical protein
VAKGCQQRDGLGYTKNFKPVIKSASIRIPFSLAIHYNWPFKQSDVSNAFFHGHLSEEVLMEYPTGFVNAVFPNHVCKLKKALYSLKQAARACFSDCHKLFSILILLDP